MNKLIEKAISHYDKNKKFQNEILSRFDHWEFFHSQSDLEEPKLKVFDKNNKLYFEANFQFISEVFNKNIWIWSWSYSRLRKNNLTNLSKRVLDYGLNITTKDIETNDNYKLVKSILTNSRFKISTDFDELILKSLSLYITKKKLIFGLATPIKKIPSTGEETKNKNKIIVRENSKSWIIITNIIKYNK